MCGLCRGVTEGGSQKMRRSTIVGSGESSVETPACRDMSLGAEELIRVESSELATKEFMYNLK
jgi:hypothetical protein